MYIYIIVYYIYRSDIAVSNFTRCHLGIYTGIIKSVVISL